jgi:phage FluMu protein Com
MSKRPTWKCDWKGCNEIAEWYRAQGEDLVKLCTHHYAELGKSRWGKPVDFSDLTREDINYLAEKDEVIDLKCPECGFVNTIQFLRPVLKCEKCGKLFAIK